LPFKLTKYKNNIMENNAELDGKYLGTISQDFAVVSNTLREAAHQLSFRKISEFPIFPISKSELPIGQLLIGRKEFKKSFKKTDEFCCLFVVDGDFVNFVFIPYPED
jgi:hypothetical protein